MISMIHRPSFSAEDSGFRIQDSGFRIQVLVLMIQVLRIRIFLDILRALENSGLLSLELRVSGFGFRV
jgi:hypothetical protein